MLPQKGESPFTALGLTDRLSSLQIFLMAQSSGLCLSYRLNEKARSLKPLIMAPQALKCFKHWIIEGHTGEPENPIESSPISATMYIL